MELKLKYPPTPEHAPDLARVCVEAARSVSGISLDFTPASLALVDNQLERFHSEGLDAESIGATLFCFGCYLGEILIRDFGGRWIWLEDSPLKEYGGPPIVIVLDAGSYWNPIGRVFERVDVGKEYDLQYFYQTIARHGPALT